MLRTPMPRDDTLPGTLPKFAARFADETRCAEVLRRWKYGDAGFNCPRCGHAAAWYLPSRQLDECRGCGKHVSLTAGTVMHGSRKPLGTWFLAMYLFVVSKQGISALDLQRQLGFGSYQTAWTWLHKLRSAAFQRVTEKLGGVIEADETWEGGLHEGHAGRPTAGEKKALVAGVIEVGGKNWGRVRLASIPNGSSASLKSFLEEHVENGSVLRTDDWSAYRKPAKELKLTHQPENVSKSEKKAHELLPAVHRVFSLVHRVLLATYQGAVSRKHLPLYLAEFEFRFNRRHSASRGLLFQRMLGFATRRAPACYWEIVGRRDARTPLRAVA